MTAITRDLVIEQGTTFVFGFTLSDTVVEDDGSVTVVGPKDLTNVHFQMQMRKAQGEPVKWEGLDTGTTPKIIVGRLSYTADPANDSRTNGRVMVVVSDEDSDAFDLKSMVYDLEMVEANPRLVTRILEGKVTVKPNITQHVTGDAGGDNDETVG